MHPLLIEELARNGGLLTTARLPEVVPRWAVFNAVRAGRLVRILPGVYRASDGPPVDRLRAAALYANGRGALSHASALVVWGLRQLTAGESIHITVPRAVRLRSVRGVWAHTRLGFAMNPSQVLYRSGLPITSLADSLVASWPMLPHAERTGCVLEAVSQRMILPIRLATALARVRHLRDRTQLAVLVDNLVSGCRSYLEIFGADHVFSGAGLPHFARQVPIRANGRTYYLDLFAEGELVNIELDGASWHSTAQQRENDLRRDAALAALGILVVRFTYRRLVNDPEGVRKEVAAILARRR